MKRTQYAFAAAVAFAFAGQVAAQTAEDLINDKATPGDVVTYGMGYDLQRFSTLNQINTENVKSLVPAWNYSMNDNRGLEGFPLVKDGVMYVTSHSNTIALDAKTGKQIWNTPVNYEADATRVACCGIINRGAALYDGKVFRGTLDAHVVALDAKTGAELWRTQSIDWHDGYGFTTAPVVANGVIVMGIAGADYGTRGFFEGYDPTTGEKLWRTYVIPEPGQPGSETWEAGGDAWKRGGGGGWTTDEVYRLSPGRTPAL